MSFLETVLTALGKNIQVNLL